MDRETCDDSPRLRRDRCLTLANAPPPSGSDYEQMRATAGRDAGSQVRLALWCEAHGLEGRAQAPGDGRARRPLHALARGLMGLVEYSGKWKRPEAVADAVRADVGVADLLAEYNGRRVQDAGEARRQWKLALWCEEKGLRDEARAHLATVVRLDPKHAEAWKRLGYKKVGNRWVTEAAAAEKGEEQLQQEADKRWRPRLERLRDALDRKGHARTRPSRIGDRHRPAGRAVGLAGLRRAGRQSSGRGGAGARPDRCGRGVAGAGDLGRLRRNRARSDAERPRPSRGATPRVGRHAHRHAPRQDQVTRSSRSAARGRPGPLYIEGEKANVRRIYAPPPAPFVAFRPGRHVGDRCLWVARNRPITR